MALWGWLGLRAAAGAGAQVPGARVAVCSLGGPQAGGAARSRGPAESRGGGRPVRKVEAGEQPRADLRPTSSSGTSCIHSSESYLIGGANNLPLTFSFDPENMLQILKELRGSSKACVTLLFLFLIKCKFA